MKSLTGVSPGIVLISLPISEEEYWPVYEIEQEPSGVWHEYDIPYQLYERYLRIHAQWLEVQDELGELIVKQDGEA